MRAFRSSQDNRRVVSILALHQPRTNRLVSLVHYPNRPHTRTTYPINLNNSTISQPRTNPRLQSAATDQILHHMPPSYILWHQTRTTNTIAPKSGAPSFPQLEHEALKAIHKATKYNSLQWAQLVPTYPAPRTAWLWLLTLTLPSLLALHNLAAVHPAATKAE